MKIFRTDVHKAYRACAVIGDDILPFDENSESGLALRDCLYRLIQRVIEEYKCSEFISGMNRGAEQLAAEIVYEFRNNGKAVTFWGVIASEEQWLDWTNPEKDRFFRIMEKADYEYRISNKHTEESRRQQYKVISEEADIFIVVLSVLSDDVRDMLSAATLSGKKIFVLDPLTAAISPFLEVI